MRAPLEVSPLIKLARWTFLGAGVVHGFKKKREYTALEAEFREKEARSRALREEYAQREKLRLEAAELDELERIFLGTTGTNDEKIALKETPMYDVRNTTIDNDVSRDKRAKFYEETRE
ncbi:hypothetical protein KM043_009112 [Ampulex compressa]|nr:hypothetical protein KM043_009112 [Ampulex compressa]